MFWWSFFSCEAFYLKRHSSKNCWMCMLWFILHSPHLLPQLLPSKQQGRTLHPQQPLNQPGPRTAHKQSAGSHQNSAVLQKVFDLVIWQWEGKPLSIILDSAKPIWTTTSISEKPPISHMRTPQDTSLWQTFPKFHEKTPSSHLRTKYKWWDISI